MVVTMHTDVRNSTPPIELQDIGREGLNAIQIRFDLYECGHDDARPWLPLILLIRPG
jgi:hypothetical protein